MLFTATTRLLVMGMGLLTSVFTARYLGVEGRGVYFFVITLSGLVSQFANLGVHSSNTYYVAQDHKLIRGLAANSVWIAIGIGGVVSLVALGFVRAMGWYTDVPTEYLVLAAIIGPLNLLFMLVSNLLVGVGRIGSFNLLELFRNFTALLAIASALLLGFGVQGALLGGAIAIALSVLAVLMALAYGDQLSFRPDAALIRSGFHYALKSYVITVAGYLVLRGNVLFLQHIGGAGETGYYSIAAQFADVLAIIPGSVGLVLFPLLTRNPEQRFTMMLRYLLMVGGIMVAAIGVLALITDPVIGTVFGEDFVPAARVLNWMLPGVFFLSMITVLSQYLSASGIPNLQVYSWGVALIVMIAANASLVPEYGALGAAASFSISHFVLMVLLVLLSLKVWWEGKTVGQTNIAPSAKPGEAKKL